MKGRAIIVKPEETLVQAKTCDFAGKTPSLAWLQDHMDGPIQIVPGFTRWRGNLCVAYCHEEGKIKKLQMNKFATTSWRFLTNTQDYIAGNLIVLTGDLEFFRSL